jgi:hypothetical protein
MKTKAAQANLAEVELKQAQALSREARASR